MAYCTASILAAIALIWTKTAWTFPAVYKPESNLPADDCSDRPKSAQSQQAVNPELFSNLPCLASELPPPNRRNKYQPEILYNTSSHQKWCNATYLKTDEFRAPGDPSMHIIQSLDYPNINSYPNNRFFIYNFECEEDENPVIDSIQIELQPPILHAGTGYCVDLVRIEPPIPNHPDPYCGDHSFQGAFHINGTNVSVMFRTSPNDNGYPGFRIRLHCQSAPMTEQDVLLGALQFASKLPMNRQETRNGYIVQYDSFAKLVDFASHQCSNSATPLSVSTHWDIVKLALQYEKVDDDEVQRAAQDVLQCFPPSQISFARIMMEETKQPSY